MTDMKNWLRTEDGFALCPRPLSQILLNMGIRDTGLSDRNPEDVESYYDDWHLYAVTGISTVFSLLKMREQEHDYIPGYSDMDDPGVTISFVPFDISLLDALEDPQNRSCTLPAFVEGFRRVTDLPNQRHSEVLREYFCRDSADGPYLVAETYLKKLLSLVSGGSLPLPERMSQAPRRVLDQLQQLNEQAGRTICDLENRRIYIEDPHNPTEEERYCLLISHTGNLSLNSFAAEVKFHADALTAWESHLPVIGKSRWYASAIRADMQLEADQWLRSKLFSPYYDENSRLDRRQAQLHGKK